eukprot:CAMPEP_0114339352 /NCGR_PEP_ID=MMETSP0101-20121206/7683_1 /TAXON_ID=38822 ORGANISM="Pteridomonas danica, Strain PT" /NCGR_SAMPLE_ID=MMETSP0101 /ASSEMBLY_ACC=CAM_ASM_000211 /LENGTH=413 /DNA_ID=CAMNT_0001472313 /DNA_START=1372 /DNA_END=2614 /DNA_ORIENTATION=+
MTDLMESQLCLLNQHLHHQEHQEDEEQKHQEQRVSEATPFEQVEHDDGGRITVSELKLKIEEWTQFIADIDESTEDAITVVSDLLDFDKASNGMLSLERGIHNMYSLIHDTIKPFEIQAKSKNIILNCESIIDNFNNNDRNHNPKNNGSHLMVHGDFTKIQQIIRNLISNALKFTPENGQVTITAQWNLDSNMSDKVSCPNNFSRCGSIVVKVKDSGAGMTPEQVGQLFQEGVQFDANKLQAGQGSGLGLWISKGVAEQHGGSLHATSEGKGYGAEFVFELPVCSLKDEEDEEQEEKDGENEKNTKKDIEKGGGGMREERSSLTLANVASTSMRSLVKISSKQSNPHTDDEEDTIGSNETTTTEMRPFYAVKNHGPLKHILLVDDAVSTRKMMSRLLKTVVVQHKKHVMVKNV